MSEEHDERLRRWRLILGGGEADGTGASLNERDQRMDEVLEQLYGRKKIPAPGLGNRFGQGKSGVGNKTPGGSRFGQAAGRQGGMEASMPDVARWLGDIRTYFPASVVRIMQRDAIDRIGLQHLLSQPEFLEMVEPDVNLVSTLLTLKDVIPNETKTTARIIVRKVVEDLTRRLENPMRQAIKGALNRAIRNRRPKHHEIDWLRTIRKNLKHYQVEYDSIIAEQLVGYGRKRSSAHDVIICIDQSGSMASSMVYASVFGAVMASIPALKTHMVVFDTSVVDLTPHLSDPVDLLFGTMLGGGTDINQALAYCQGIVNRPNDTTLILISDLYEGGRRDQMLQKAQRIKESGVNMVALLALSDTGTPSYDHQVAMELGTFGIPAFACTPDLFPELMAATMNRKDLGAWAASHGIKVSRGREDEDFEL
jgi:Mg-chelatase subunit ChlD